MSRLNISHNVVSKRKVERLIKEGYVNGYDDPRVFIKKIILSLLLLLEC